MRHAIQSDAAPDHVWITGHALSPEIFRHHRDIGGFFFLRQKVPTTNRTHTERIEVIWRDPAAEDLHRIAQAGQREGELIFRAESVKNRLALPVMLKTRRRNREFEKISLPGVGIHANDTGWLFEWQTAQKKIINQAEDCRVQPDAESKRGNRD